MSNNAVDVGRLSTAQVKAFLALGQQQPVASVVEPIRFSPRTLSQAALQLLLADLQSPVLVPQTGPLSFARLAGLPAEGAAQFEGKSYLQALTSLSVNQEGLETLSVFGRLLTEESLPDATKRAGAVILALARLALHTRFGLLLQAGEAEATAALVRSLGEARNTVR